MKTIRTRFVEIVSYFFILLFCYASMSKITDFENFQIQIAQSPLLSANANVISFAILAVELVVSIILIFGKTRRLGLYASFILMVLFSFYIFLILNYSEFVPCSCGGILEKMDWGTHLVFNLICVGLATTAILLESSQKKNQLVTSALLMVFLSAISIGSLLFLHHRSNYLVTKENNFTRRFLQHPLDEVQRTDLKVNSYYFAGESKDSLYLGNHTTPFVLTSVDKQLRMTKTLSLVPDQSDFIFKSSRILVKNNNYYLYDGTVPVVFTGILGKSKMETLSYRHSHFSQMQVLDDELFPIITYSPEKKIQSLGLLFPNHPVKVVVFPELLEKIKDGVFDTDGKLILDHSSNKIIYAYSYKNTFVVLDKNLRNKKTFHTIDDLSIPQIEIARLKDGTTKLKKPPVIVNKSVFAYQGVLFIESERRGKYEDQKQSKKTITIDMYATDDQKYLGSFYLPNPLSSKKTQLYVKGGSLYLLIENDMIRYRFTQNILKYFKSGEAENLNPE